MKYDPDNTPNKSTDSTCDNCKQPSQAFKRSGKGQEERNEKCGKHTHCVLAGRTDIEESHLECKAYGKAAHHDRNGEIEHVSKLFESTRDYGEDACRSRCGACNQHNEKSDLHKEKDGNYAYPVE